MSEPESLRRRWPYAVLGIVLLGMGLPTAWRFRPLNPTEQLAVGHWGTSSDSDLVLESITLTRGRRFHRTRYAGSQSLETTTGTWEGSDGQIVLSLDEPFRDRWRRRLLEYLDSPRPRDREATPRFRYRADVAMWTMEFPYPGNISWMRTATRLKANILGERPCDQPRPSSR